MSLSNSVCFSGVHLHRNCTIAVPTVHNFHGSAPGARRMVHVLAKSNLYLFFFFPLFIPLCSQQIFGVIIRFKQTQIYHLAGKKSMMLLGSTTGTYQREQLNGSVPCPSQQISRVHEKDLLVPLLHHLLQKLR